MKTKNTLRALISSVLALVLCLSMLVGTTFAWFTDSVTTGVNTIQSGSLDVDMVDKDGKSLVGKTLSFRNVDGSADILWEPGAEFKLDTFRIKNNGTLALKYKVVISGLTGDVELLDVIDFTVNNGTPLMDYFTTPAAGAGEVVGGILLEAGASSEEITISGKMREEAGNEYQNKSIKGVSITVYATQAMKESDSFGNTYDGGATYLDLPIAKVSYDGQVTAEGVIDGSSYVGGNSVLPTVNLDSAYTFTAPEELDDRFQDWVTDFEVSVDKDIPENALILAGRYGSYANGLWVGFHNPIDVSAGQKIRLMQAAGFAISYNEVVTSIKEFGCGVSAVLPDALDGVTITVNLKLFEVENGQETGNSHVIGTYSYTFHK